MIRAVIGSATSNVHHLPNLHRPPSQKSSVQLAPSEPFSFTRELYIVYRYIVNQ